MDPVLYQTILMLISALVYLMVQYFESVHMSLHQEKDESPNRMDLLFMQALALMEKPLSVNPVDTVERWFWCFETSPDWKVLHCDTAMARLAVAAKLPNRQGHFLGTL